MTLNWPLIILLFCLCLPGVIIAIPRLIRLLLPNNSEQLIQKINRLAIAQTLFMVFIMCLGGMAFSHFTGLGAPILNAMLEQKPFMDLILNLITPILIYTSIALIIFFILFYGLIASILDEHSFQTIRRIHLSQGIDGSVLYGGVVEEILARWGLMNMLVFFGLMFKGQLSASLIWFSILVSSLLFTIIQIPIYLAAGCLNSRRLIYVISLINLWQAIIFGLLFWQYGLLASIFSHMLFHAVWAAYDRQ